MRRLWDFLVLHQGVVGYLILLGALLLNLYAIRDTTISTNRTVKREIPRLEKTIANQEYVLNQQAVPAIVDLLARLKANGIEQPTVLLGPTNPPYEVQNP